jgi:hypothetical protein
VCNGDQFATVFTECPVHLLEIQDTGTAFLLMSAPHRNQSTMGRLRLSLTVALAASALWAAPALVAADARDASYTFAASPETVNPASYDAGVVKPASVNSAQMLSVGTTMLRSVDDATALAPTGPAVSNTGDATTTAAPESTAVVAQDASAVASNATVGTCPAYNELTTACSNACGSNALCIKYRSDGRCVSGDASTCVHPKGDPCAYECLEGTSGDFDQWTVTTYGVPSWDRTIRNNKMVEAIRALDVPRNTTQLYVANRWHVPSQISFSPSGGIIC